MKCDTISLCPDLFDNRKIRYLHGLPNGEKIIIIWMKLLCLAVQCDSCGEIFLTDKIPFTDDALADELDYPKEIVEYALDKLSQMGMVLFSEDGFMLISGWHEKEYRCGCTAAQIDLNECFSEQS